jgi:hypothetical protein
MVNTMDNKGVHNEHCCQAHGCKYGEPDCPVESKELRGIWCEDCDYDQQESNTPIGLLISLCETLIFCRGDNSKNEMPSTWKEPQKEEFFKEIEELLTQIRKKR